MTQEEKQLLLKDLCGRLPYGVKMSNINAIHNGLDLPPITIDINDYENSNPLILINSGFIPYLRPMSSMTKEEGEEMVKIHINDRITSNIEICDANCVDFYNSHYLDYRGLIPMGLALEAPEGMYNKEESEKGSDIPVPKTVDEAISTLEKILSDEDREYLLKNRAISMHDSLGRWIRNEWGLWTGSELKDELMSMNKGLNHPDDMSNYIIEEFIKYWNNKL